MGKKYLLPLIFLVLYCFSAVGQIEVAQSSHYNWFDKLVGIENTGIYDGIAYVETQRTINEKTKFFKSQDYLKGSIIYNGQPHFDLDMKYNIFGDQLLLKLEDRLGGITLQLFKDKISRFTIDGHRFMKIVPENSDEDMSGFYEIVLQRENFDLLVKHIKREFIRKDRSSIYYEFINQKNENLLVYQDTFYKLESKKDLVDLFPDLKKEINKFYSTARRLRNSNPDEFMKALITRLDILLSQKNNASAE
ncbi:MAG: hypothetical protein ACR2MT_09850 [Aurantibacter sp.]